MKFVSTVIFAVLTSTVQSEELPVTTSDVFVQSGEVSDSSAVVMVRCNNELDSAVSLPQHRRRSFRRWLPSIWSQGLHPFLLGWRIEWKHQILIHCNLYSSRWRFSCCCQYGCQFHDCSICWWLKYTKVCLGSWFGRTRLGKKPWLWSYHCQWKRKSGLYFSADSISTMFSKTAYSFILIRFQSRWVFINADHQGWIRCIWDNGITRTSIRSFPRRYDLCW